jgi:hypothetical protein
VSRVWGLDWFHGCEGPQPSRSVTTMEALIAIWWASGPGVLC